MLQIASPLHVQDTSCTVVCPYGLMFFIIYVLLAVFAPSRQREVFVCASVCVRVCVRTGTPVLIQILVDTCRYICAHTDPHYQSRLHLSIYMPILPCNQHIHKFAATSQLFFFSPELPNARSRRLAIVVTLIPRFLLQLASKRHCKFPNNWDEVLCKSPSRHQTFPSKRGGRVFRGGRVALFDVGISSHVSVIPFF